MLLLREWSVCCSGFTFVGSFIWSGWVARWWTKVFGEVTSMFFAGRQQIGGQSNFLAQSTDDISSGNNQLQWTQLKTKKNTRKLKVVSNHVSTYANELTFPPWLNAYPLPLINCPFTTVRPPVIAFTAWNNVFNMDFFNAHASNSFACEYKNEYWIRAFCFRAMITAQLRTRYRMAHDVDGQ